MAQAGLSTEEDIPEGKVNQVCREWLVREDNAIAYRLQDEEINQFYEGNRFKNQVFRSDLEKARFIQEKEEFERLVEYERDRQRMADEDERIAKEIQDALLEEEERKAQQLLLIAEEDSKLAQRLQDKERERLKRRKLQRERLQVEKIRLEKFGSLNPDLLDSVNRTIADMDEADVKDLVNLAPGTSNSFGIADLDLSEFSVPPPIGLTKEEMRQFMAEQDEELAQFLHQYEARRKDALAREKQQWIEAQDYEIACILQDEERARAKRYREKVRKAKLERERLKKGDPEGESNVGGRVNGDDATSTGSATLNGNQSNGHYYSREYLNSHSGRKGSSIGTGSAQSYQDLRQGIVNTCFSNDSCSSIHLNHYHNEDDDGEVNFAPAESNHNDLAKRDLPPIPSFHNVAMDLDPTYKKSQKVGKKSDQKRQPQQQEGSPELTGVHFAQLCRVSPVSASSLQTQTSNSILKPPMHIELDDQLQSSHSEFIDVGSSAYLAYQPVQGQKRVVGKRKKSRETCRTQ